MGIMGSKGQSACSGRVLAMADVRRAPRRAAMFALLALATIVALSPKAGAQTKSSATDASTVEAPAVKRQLYPQIDPALAVTGGAVLEELRKGGFMLYLRHTETGAVTEQCDVSNLSLNGLTMARDLGAQLKQLRIPIDRVISSPVCRVQETAKLLELGPVELSAALAQATKTNSAELHVARTRLLATPPRQGMNTIAVSHMHAGAARHQTIDLEFGEIIVFQAAGAAAKPVARVRAEQWQAFAAIDKASR